MITQRLCKTAVLCLVLVALLASSAYAVTISVAPSGDGYVRHRITNSENTYQVTSNDSRVSCSFSDQTRPIGDGTYYLDVDCRVGVIEIPISSLRGMNLTGAGITFNCYYLGGIWWEIVGKPIDGDGVITQSDYQPAYAPGGMHVADYGDAVEPGWVSRDAASYVLDQLAAGRSWACFALTSWGDGSGSIGSAEGGQAAYLEITPVPEPSSFLALGAGLVSMAGLIRRRMK